MLPRKILDTITGNKALEHAIETNNFECLRELLKEEYKSHAKTREGIRCLRNSIKTDDMSDVAIDMLEDIYEENEKTFLSKYAIPFVHTIPLIAKLVSMIYDQATDVLLLLYYYKQASNSDNNIPLATTSNASIITPITARSTLTASTSQSASTSSTVHNIVNTQSKLSTKDYAIAKYYTLSVILFIFFMNGLVTTEKLLQSAFVRKLVKDRRWLKYILTIIFYLVIGPVLSPFVIIYEMIQMIRTKFRIVSQSNAHKKTELKNIFWKQQLQFGIFENMEATEASAQLLLQVWLMAIKFPSYYQAGILDVFQQAANGAVFFFSSTLGL